ncbi:hypothetical protein QEJ31_02195 [Pigmentibacter sp. JX0631]|uniref:hypothetical protein n=1 Tax=Pigmentibacter sp. JX0631 TaxID=2976982 RepID=UPI00246867DF|nr:hypothetical protein [Pigmentibacter sp. JX0631]WGL60415.1 hypothetical protein QEJ31_02195 [Pigmentibacter sp. JX0631]
MGLFSKLFSSSSKSYDKYGDVLKKILTTKEQRLEAIEALEGLTAEQAVPQLLKRFEISVDSGLQDTKEKEQCMKLIVAYGDQAKVFIENVLAKERKISWPIKIAEKLYAESEFINLLLSNLSTNIAEFDEATIERNEEILLALKDVKEANDIIVGKVVEFLSSRDDNLRMAALECLEEQARSNRKAKDIILNLAKSPISDDNSRFLGVVNSIIQNHRWNET